MKELKVKKHRVGLTAKTILSHIYLMGPSTAKEALSSVRPKDGCVNWGSSYFLGGRGNGYESSLIRRRFVTIVGHTSRRARIFEITPLGIQAMSQA